MVLANDEDQRQWGWPISDETLAQLFEKVLAQQPNSVGLDIYRDLPVPIGGGPGHEHLTQILSSKDNVFGIFKYQDTGTGASVNPPPALKGTERISFNDIPSDTGGIIRRGLLYVGDDTGVYEFFGLKLALHYLAQKGIVPQGDPNNPNALVLGNSTLIPMDENFGGYVQQDTGGFQLMLTYPGAPTGFRTISFTQALTADPETLSNWVKDKIVIIGVNAEATPDFVYTPFGLW
jgi:adenylate cyclase